ncbi:MAG: transposase [Bacteroidales bacterium]|nr:transposase [Bacteroidales bacterium]MBP3202302.1 transposase [Bacteroidales bacterium]
MKHKRNSRLIDKRNRKICARYYYWTEVQRMRFDDAIHQLSEEEFFLSEATILNILRKMERIGTAELLRNAGLKRPRKAPAITADMLAFMSDK